MVTETLRYSFTTPATVSYELPERSRVEIVLYDMLGREIARFREGEQEAGFRSMTIGPGANPEIAIPDGVCVCRIRAMSLEDPGRLALLVQKIVLLR